MAENFQVLFSGELAEGRQEADVRDRMAGVLAIDDRKAKALFSGRTVVLRSQLSEREALTLQQQLGRIGAATRIKDLTPRDEDTHRDATLADITAAHQACPRCGHMQLDASHCARCGFDLQADMKRRQKEDRLIEKKIRELRNRQNMSPLHAPPAPEPTPEEDKKPRLGKMVAWLKKSS